MYLPWLQIRHRWHEVKPNNNVGDLVLLLESQTEGRRDYPKALVVETYPDGWGFVRNSKIRMSDGRMFTRDVLFVVHLEGFKSKS